MKHRNNLKATAVPSLNLPTISHKSIESSSRIPNRSERLNDRNKTRTLTDRPLIEEVCTTMNVEDFPVKPPETEEIEAANTLLTLLSAGDQVNVKTFKDFEVQVNTPNKLTLLDFIVSPAALTSLTGLNSIELLNQIIATVQLIYSDKRLHKLQIKARIVLLFVKLKWNLSYSILGILFGITPTLCQTYIVEMIRIVGVALKPAIIFPSKEEIYQNLPICFEKFQDVQIILDCTEIFTQIPKCLCCRIRFYSHYKGAQTVKFMVGVSPAGLITFVSAGYGGRASDKLIFESSGLINLLEEGSGIMVDKGFLIDDICLTHNVKMYRPPFLRGKKQLDEGEVELNSQIAAARVHIERVNQRLKIFKILSGKLTWNLVPYIDDIFLIISAVTNLSKPILADDKFLK